MNLTQAERYTRWHRRLETTLTVVAEWIPGSPGILLRRSLYPVLFAKLGDLTQIQIGFEYDCAKYIEIGREVKISRYVRIQNFSSNGQVLLGNKVRLERGVDIKAHPDGCIEIGDRTYIGPYTCLGGRHIKIGQNCLIASHSGLYANTHNFADPHLPICEQGLTYKTIVIEDDCWLGSGVRVVGGVTIGKGSVIGAGAVVTRDIPPYSIAVGVPARVISTRGKQDVSPSQPIPEVISI